MAAASLLCDVTKKYSLLFICGSSSHSSFRNKWFMLYEIVLVKRFKICHIFWNTKTKTKFFILFKASIKGAASN